MIRTPEQQAALAEIAALRGGTPEAFALAERLVARFERIVDAEMVARLEGDSQPQYGREVLRAAPPKKSYDAG